MTRKKLQEEGARLQREHGEWLQKLGEEDPQEDPGTVVANLESIRQRLAQIPAQLQQLEESGEKSLSRTDPESRSLHQSGGFVRGYTAAVVVSDEHFILAQRVTQNKADNDSLVPLLDLVEGAYGERPQVVMADSGFYRNENVDEMERRGIDGYVPDSTLVRELNGWGPAQDTEPIRHRGLQRMRQKAAQRRRAQAILQTPCGGRTGNWHPERANGSAPRLAAQPKESNHRTGIAALAYNLRDLHRLGLRHG